MSEHVTLEPPPPAWEPPPPLPAWLARRFLEPEEQLLWWQGPPEGKGLERLLDDKVLLTAGFAVLVFVLAGLALGPLGLFSAGILGLGVLVVSLRVSEKLERRTWDVLTDRRLFTVTGRTKVREYDLVDLLLLAEGLLPDKPPEALSKAGPIAHGAKVDAITDLESIRAMARLLARIRQGNSDDKVRES
jgi:hypothetical protein